MTISMFRKITDITELISVIKEVNKQYSGQIWWRGQRDADWHLSASIFRKKEWYENEQHYMFRFQQKAPSRHIEVPALNDYAGWLFLMQHYGMPTRLLDWSESPLIGCYFGTECNPASETYPNDIPDTDGALFALSPYLLNNDQINCQTLLSPSDPIPCKSFHRAFLRNVEEPSNVIAIRPSEVDVRLLTQLSVFSLHSNKLEIDNLPNNEDFLRKFIIPKEHKPKLKEQLKYLGIRESSIFPDLEHLAIDVSSAIFAKRPFGVDGIIISDTPGSSPST